MRIHISILAAFAAIVLTSAQAGDVATSLNAGLSLTDGNSETLSLNVGAAAVKGDPAVDDNFTTLGVEYNYGETASSTTVENVQAALLHRKVLTGNTYLYEDASFLYDDIAAIDHRFIVGVGLGQYLVRDAKTTLGVEFGVAGILEDVGDASDEVFALRFGQNLTHQLSETAKVWESVEYLPEAEDFDNYLINAELGIEAAINGDLALRVVLQDRYDATPALGLDENDLNLIAGLSYKL
jgi:putative salt-induced outer membrane protein YdiY